MENYIEALFQCLPATSYEEIRLAMQKELGRRISLGVVNNALHYVRTHVEECGWTVGYVKRGVEADGDEGRYFAMLLEKDGTFHMDGDTRRHAANGTHATVSDIATKSKNMSVMIEVRMQYESSRTIKEALADMKENLDFVARRASRLKTKLDDASAA